MVCVDRDKYKRKRERERENENERARQRIAKVTLLRVISQQGREFDIKRRRQIIKHRIELS